MSEEMTTQDQNNEVTDSQGNNQDQDSGSKLDNLFKPTEQSEITELEKLERFKFKGEEWTPQKAEQALMRQQDYTKKAQEIAEQKKEYEAELKHREYRSNLKADINHVLKDPSLVDAFKKTYPEEYHYALELALGKTQQQVDQKQEHNLPPEILEKLKKLDEHDQTLNEFKQKAYETEKQAIDARLEANESKFTQKYPYSKFNLGAVYGALETYAVNNKISDIKDIPDSVFEHMYKTAHEQQLKNYETINQEKVKKQMSASSEAQDIGKGGGTPGEAPKKIRLRDVADHVIRGLDQ